MGAWSDAFTTAHDLNTWARSLRRSSKLLAIVPFGLAVLFMRGGPVRWCRITTSTSRRPGTEQQSARRFPLALNDACNSAHCSWALSGRLGRRDGRNYPNVSYTVCVTHLEKGIVQTWNSPRQRSRERGSA